MRKVPGALAALWLLLASAAPVGAQFFQQGSKLIGTGSVLPTRQGSAVAVSGDGNTAVVGGYIDNSSQGAAWVYARVFGVWSQQGAKLVGTGGSNPQQGTSVAISGSGNTIAVGGPSDGTSGAVWIFERSGLSWTQQGTKLVGTSGVGARQATSVALSADGNTLAIGGKDDNALQGAVWVFTRSGGVWSQQGGKLVGAGAAGDARQGVSVALSADGNTLVFGGSEDSTTHGATWAFTRSGGVWSQQGPKLVGTGAVGGANQGASVAVSADGNTAVVGGPQDNGGLGALWVFTRSGGVWSQQGGKLVGLGAVGTPVIGGSVAISGDAKTVIAGGSGDNGGLGAAWAFVRRDGAWIQPDAKLVGTGAIGNAGQGYSVALSENGGTAVMGGWLDNTNTGAAWTFVNATPAIVSVTDVPNDQGGRVSVRWNASPADGPPGFPIAAYWIWRQVPVVSLTRAMEEALRPATGGRARTLRRSVLNGQTIYWELVGSQPAHHHAGYSYSAPTLSDSVPGSNPYTLFMVEAEESASGEFWPSSADSGYSVDNLAPATPAPFTAAYSGGVTHLHWGANPEADFAEYRLHRGGSEGFVPGPANLLTVQPDTGFGDPGDAGGYYKLCAVDVHGNVSPYALLTPAATLDAPGATPRGVSLSPVAPNPVRDDASFHFTLPREADTRLAIHDAFGREVCVLVRGPSPAGEHTVRWEGRDATGRTVPSGIYFVRLDAAGRSLRSRFAMIH
jgi:hypothetical protein